MELIFILTFLIETNNLFWSVNRRFLISGVILRKSYLYLLIILLVVGEKVYFIHEHIVSCNHEQAIINIMLFYFVFITLL